MDRRTSAMGGQTDGRRRDAHAHVCSDGREGNGSKAWGVFPVASTVAASLHSVDCIRAASPSIVPLRCVVVRAVARVLAGGYTSRRAGRRVTR